jgi:purine-nucleoside phosphorylase
MRDTEMIINPGREKGEPELPAAGMLLVNPAEAAAGLRLAKSRGGQIHFLFNSRLVHIPGNEDCGPFFIAGPSVGAPMAVLTLEKLIALGARHIIVFGWCGSLCDTVRIGDVLLPTWAIRDEGTSAHYPLGFRAESPADTRQLLVDLLAAHGMVVHAGPIWTTDAPYRESVHQVERLRGQGVLGVDMEYGALVTAAAFRNISLTAVLLVSDELWTGTWNPGFRAKDFKKKSSGILHLLADFCAGLHAEK